MELWIEIRRFITNHLKFFIVSLVGFMLLFAGVSVFMRSDSSEEVLPMLQIEDVDTAISFDFYVEDNEGRDYSNSGIINEYFNSPEMVKKLKDETGIALDEINSELNQQSIETLRSTQSEEDLEEFEKLSVVQVSHNTSSNVMHFIATTEDEAVNRQIADFYYDQLNQIPFIEKDNVYTFKAPYSVKEEQLLDEDEEEKGFSLSSMLKFGVLGAILGGAFAFGVALLRALFNRKITYSFAYPIEEGTDYIIYDKHLDNAKQIQNFISYPLNHRKLLISEVALDQQATDILMPNDQVPVISDLAEKKDEMSDENILVVIPNQTTRKWLNEQLRLAKLDGILLKIIQMNLDK